MKIIIVFTLSICVTCLNAQIYTGKTAAGIIENAEKIMIKEQSSFPSYIEFRKDKPITVEQLLQKWQKEFDLEYFFISREKDQIGFEHIKYQQLINHIPIEWATFTFHVKNQYVVSFSGNLYKTVKYKNNVQLITFADALNKAKIIHNANKYMWEDENEEKLLKKLKHEQATYFPTEQKVWIYNNDMLELAYKITLFSKYPLSKKDYYISAQTGDVLKQINKIQTTDVPGTAITRYSGTQTIIADAYYGSYRLRESGRGNGIATLNMQMTENYSSAVDFIDTDNYWNNVNAQQDEVATDAHWATEKYYDYLLNTFGRNSIDNNGFALYNYVHANLIAMGFPSNVNAFWDGQRMTYGDGNATLSPLTTVDIVSHEITHGLTEYTANLIYSDESGALNEGFSDIFGTVVEFYAKPLSANWTIGEDIGVAFRSLANPNLYNNPDTYLGTYWDFNNEAHQNSTVLSHWFYLLSQGGNGVNDIGNSYNVNAIGINNAAAIAYRMLVYYLPPNSTYYDARFFSIIAASDLFGTCSAEVEAVTNAMYAVGIGQAYQPNVVADFSSSITQTCQAPFTVQFENNSINGYNFYWNFGDGTTSTDINPQHTYLHNGNYSVQLIVDGGLCGQDTLIKNDYISIDPQNPCIIIMPLNGTGTNITSCTGTLYDGGGPNGNYIDNADAITTIAPTGASSITLTFNSFDIEPGSGSYCNYDYVEIFDGPSTSSNSLGRFCNTTGSPGTITSTGGALTILLHSDPGVTKAGFEATWTCEILNVAPIAHFNVQIMNQCSGLVSFYDQSLHNPTSWLWNFGDGNTSNQQNPTHEYLNNGNYNVQLIVSNNFGSDTINNIITITRPEAPQVSGDTICTNESAMLISNGNGTQLWYSEFNDTIAFYTGDTLYTPLLNQTITYWAQNAILNPSQYVGDNRYNTDGSYYNSSTAHYIVFDCFTECKLVSVYVNAGSAGNRTITLSNSQGNVLLSKTVYLPADTSRVILNFDLPVQNNLRLVGPPNPNLWRNNNLVAFYPYELPGVLTLKSSSAHSNPTGYYYFFYNWEVKLPDCYSVKVPVVAYVENCNNVHSDLINSFQVYPNPANDFVIFKWQSERNIKAISLRDQLGRNYPITLINNGSKNEYKINVNQLYNGIYFLEIADDLSKSITKLCINH